MRSRMLKGLGRLILTSAVVCGVSLILCGTDVKAMITASDITAQLAATPNTKKNDNRIEVKVHNTETDSIVIEKIEFSDSTTVLYTITPGDTVATGATSNSYFAKNSDIETASSTTHTTKVQIQTVNLTYHTVDADGVAGSQIPVNCIGLSLDAAPVYKAKVTLDTTSNYNTQHTIKLAAVFTVNNNNVVYGFEGDTYSIDLTTTDTSISNYYQYIGDTAGFTVPALGSSNWKAAEGALSGTFGTANVDKKVAYFPIIKDVVVTSKNVGSEITPAAGAGEATAPSFTIANDKTDIHTTYKLVTLSGESADDTVISAHSFTILPVNKSGTSDTDLTTCTNVAAVSTWGDTIGKGKITLGQTGYLKDNALLDPTQPGTLAFKFATQYPSGAGSIANAQTHVIATATPSTYAGTLSLKVTPSEIILAKGASKELTIAGLPSGVDWSTALGSLSATGINIDPASSSDPAITVTYVTGSYDASTKSCKLKFTAGANSSVDKSVTFNMKVDNPLSPVSWVQTSVKVTVVDSATLITNGGKNFVTVGYDFDLFKLLTDAGLGTDSVTVKSSSNSTVSVSGGKVNFKDPGEYTVTAGGQSFKITAYAKPTATYSSRTIKVTLPAKISTGYDVADNLKEVTGFSLKLEDTNGNVLASFDESKFKKASDLDTSKYSYSKDSSGNITLTIPAADVESLVTTAASNSKFSQSNDTTSVNFRMTPMGYKASGSDIAAGSDKESKTTQATVYRVMASGTDFSTSYAWGLDGQSVNLVAYPASGKTFSQWSDGNTSNPRAVTISSSGTRAFQAVAGERVNPTGGTGGADSSLYDSVPQTAESSSAIWLIVFMVFAVIGTAYALYLQLKAATSKNGK